MPIQYKINVFKDLVIQYPSWEELQKYLESPEGGLFRVADNKENSEFCVIRYEKGTSKMDLPHSKWFRSVVWNTKTNRPVCIAPPKAAAQEFPFKTFKDVSDAGIMCQELHDGFMINCFKAVGDETFHITSRSRLSAAGKFYSNKSFRELFEEAYVNTNSGLASSYEDIRSPNAASSEVATFYSFLVQHVEHRNVKPIKSNRVYLVHSGVVYNDGRIEIEDSPEMVRGVPNIDNIPLVQSEQPKSSYAQVVLANADSVFDDSEVQKWVKKQLVDKDWSFQGLVFKDGAGNRWRYRSEKYSAVKTLRGNSPNIIERFAQLYTQSLIVRYLEYFPEDKKLIVDHMKIMDILIKFLYDNYVDIHITKARAAETVDKMYLPHLYSIHGIFLNQLKPSGKKVNFCEIKEYLHKQPWQRIVFLIKKLPKA